MQTSAKKEIDREKKEQKKESKSHNFYKSNNIRKQILFVEPPLLVYQVAKKNKNFSSSQFL